MTAKIIEFDPRRPTAPFKAWLKGLQQHLKKSGERKPSMVKLIALSAVNDPFYIGGPAQEKAAAWFATIWQRLDLRNGIHLRRIHYRLLDLENFKKPDGMPYGNTKRDWVLLEAASKCARVLRLVPAHEFEDRRNPEAITPGWIKDLDTGTRPHIVPPDPTTFSLPSILLDNCELPTIEAPFAFGYAPDDHTDRPYYAELWIEKTTMNDILVPLCSELGIALVPAAGIQSVTASVNMLQRVQRLKKPGRVFYISDHDPAGKNMPTSVARHLEFWRRYYAPEASVCLQPLVLTREQVAKYKLPKNVISGRSKAAWEASEGKGGVELDALEGRVPGELERIIRAALKPYRDNTLPKRLREAEKEADELVDEEWSAQTAEIESELDTVRDKVQKIIRKYQPRVRTLNIKLEQELRPA